jgi:hypothetical protein
MAFQYGVSENRIWQDSKKKKSLEIYLRSQVSTLQNHSLLIIGKSDKIPVSFEAFKTINIQDTNQELRFRVLSDRFIDFINQPAKIYEK